MRDWRAANGLAAEPAWRDLIDLEARAAALVDHLVPGSDRFVLAATKAHGVHGAASDLVARSTDRFGHDRVRALSLADAGVGERGAAAMVRAPLHPDPEAQHPPAEGSG